MSDANYPSVGLQVDLDDFALLDRQIDRGVEAYGRLQKAAINATKVDNSQADAASQRRVRAAESAAQAQIMSTRQILAAQRGLANAQAQQDASTARAREAATRQQIQDAERTVRAEMAAAQRGLAEFRKSIDARVSAGRAAAIEEQRQTAQTFALRQRLNAQRLAEAAKIERAETAAANRAAKEQDRADREAHTARMRRKRDEEIAAERLARAEIAAAQRVARERQDYLARAAKTRLQSTTALPEVVGNIGVFDGARAAMARFGQATDGIRSKLHDLRVAFFDVRTVVALFLGGLVVGPIVRFADSMTALEARIGFFAESSKDVPYTFQAIYETAQRARAPLEAVGTLYTRLAPLADQLGRSQLQLLRVTETVQKGIAVGGASAAEASAASQQLAQALASNRLGGDELRSLAENAPVLLGAIAKQLNMSTGEFIKWAHEGKANTEVIIGALEAAGPKIDALFANFPVTVSQGITMVSNSVQKLVGEVNSATQIGAQIGAAFVDFSAFLGSPETIAAASTAVTVLVAAFKALASVIDILIKSIPAIGALLVVLATRAVFASTAVRGIGMAWALTAAVAGPAAATQIAAVNSVAAAYARLRVAGSAALAFVGGPMGAAVLIAAGAFAVFSANAKTAQQSLDKFDDAQQSAASAMDRALTVMEAYGADTSEMTSLLLKLNGIQEDQVQGLDDAGRAAVARAENERTLTVALLRRAAAEQLAAAASLDRGAVMTRITRVSQQLNPEVAGARVRQAITGKANPMVTAADAEVARLQGLENMQSSLADKLRESAPGTLAAADILENAKLKVTVPKATGSGGVRSSADDDKVDKAAANRAASLARELAAMKATAAANIELADAWGVSEAAALRQQAAVEATGKAIKRRGDVDAFVAAQMNVNASEAAATAAKEVFFLDQKAKAQGKANDAVRSGQMTSQAAAEQMAIDLELASMQAQADAASGPAKERLTQAIKDKSEALLVDNALSRESQRLADREAASDNAAVVQREIELIGKSNRERAVSIAMLQKELELKAKGPLTQGAAEDIIQAGVDAGQRDDLEVKTQAYNDSLSLQADLLNQIADAASAAGSSLADAFGGSVGAIGEVVSVLTAYQAKQAEIAEDRERYLKSGQSDAARLKAFDDAATTAQIQNYGNLASAAKGLFSERSRGYKILEGAEKAFRLFEFAMAAKSVAVKTAETAAKIGLFGAQAQAAAMAGAANMFATLGPAGFAAVAAMVAVLAGFGLALSGGGGGVPGATDMADRQAAQGAGSVLGDAAEKSASLTRALELVAQNSNKDLEYSNSMLKALQAIETGIGAVAAGLARSLGAGGSLDTAGLNLGSTSKSGTVMATALGGVVGFALSQILPSWFGSKTTRTLQDQGLEFGSQSLSDITTGGIRGQTYQQVLENTKKKAFGITYSNKNKVSTTTGELDADFTNQVSGLIASLRGAVLEGAKVLGVDGAEAVLASFEVNLGKLSFKDMSGPEIQEALNAIFGKLGDDLAATAIPSLTNLQKVGEGAFETLARVVRNYQVLDTSLTSIGMSFGSVGVASLEARERLIDLAGGIDALTEQTAYFAENFLTDLERMAPIQKAVATELARLNLQGVTTKEQFKNVVLGLDLTTQAGAEMYAALMALAPAFEKVIDFSTTGSVAVQSARDALEKAYESERSALQATIDTTNKAADAIDKFNAGLDAGPLSGATLMETTERTRRAYLSTQSSAATGDLQAQTDLPASAQAFLEASRKTSATLVDYLRDVAAVRNGNAAAAASARQQASLAEKQLEALQASVSGLIVLNETTLSVRDAIIALQVAIAGQQAAQAAAAAAAQQAAAAAAAQAAAAAAGGGSGASGGQNLQQTVQDFGAYIANYADVAAEYQRNLSSAKGRALLDQLGINSAADFGEYHYNTKGKNEDRAVPTTSVPLVRTAAEAKALGGASNDNGDSLALQGIAEQLENLTRATETGTVASNKTARILGRWDGDGQPETRVVV